MASALNTATTASAYPRLAFSADSPGSFLRSDPHHECIESCDELYHVARANEEADLAADMVDGAERRAHEDLAAMHAKAAAKLASQGPRLVNDKCL